MESFVPRAQQRIAALIEGIRLGVKSVITYVHIVHVPSNIYAVPCPLPRGDAGLWRFPS